MKRRAFWLGCAAVLLGASACSQEVPIGSFGGSPGGVGESVTTGPPPTSTTTFSSSTGSGIVTSFPCPVKTLATGLQNPKDLLYVDGNLFVFTLTVPNGSSTDEYGSIYRVPIDGGDSQLLADHLATGQDPALSSDAKYLFWIAATNPDGKIWRTATADGKTDAIYTADKPSGDSSDAPRSLWGLDDQLYFGRNGGIGRVEADGSGETSILALDPTSTASSVVVSGPRVFWIQSGENEATTLRTMLVGGSDPVVLLSGYPGISRFVVYGNNVYAIDPGQTPTPGPGNEPPSGDGMIVRVAVDQSAPPVEIANVQPFPQSITADVSGLYWGGSSMTPYGLGGGESSGLLATYVVRVPLSSAANLTGPAAPQVIAPRSITSRVIPCDDGICWADMFTGTVERYTECQ